MYMYVCVRVKKFENLMFVRCSFPLGEHVSMLLMFKRVLKNHVERAQLLFDERPLWQADRKQTGEIPMNARSGLSDFLEMG